VSGESDEMQACRRPDVIPCLSALLAVPSAAIAPMFRCPLMLKTSLMPTIRPGSGSKCRARCVGGERADDVKINSSILNYWSSERKADLAEGLNTTGAVTSGRLISYTWMRLRSRLLPAWRSSPTGPTGDRGGERSEAVWDVHEVTVSLSGTSPSSRRTRSWILKLV
jgi:hypothetical protein